MTSASLSVTANSTANATRRGNALGRRLLIVAAWLVFALFLLLPLLMMMIAPVALFIATTHVLNKLSTDSEIIVMNAAGMSPWRLFKTFIPVVLIVSGVIAVTAVKWRSKAAMVSAGSLPSGGMRSSRS